MSGPAQLAKLSRPRLHAAVPRARLFQRLDDARAHGSAICIVGPPGSGKTTLAASWLDARRIRSIWYQLDAGDADLATFFHYLGRAASTFGRRQQPLPALTPEYLPDVAGFARRFFRDLFSRMPRGAVLALDNCHEVPAENAFHRIIAEAVTEAPREAMVLLISRRDPPAQCARLIANERMTTLDWEELKLTPEEAEAIALKRGDIDVRERPRGARAGQVHVYDSAAITL